MKNLHLKIAPETKKKDLKFLQGLNFQLWAH
jgi:hypothetical protein